MDSPNHQFETEVEYKDGDKGTGAWAIKPGPAEVPEIPGDDLASEDFEGALWSQITFFGGDWITTAAQAHNGTLSFTNLDIDDNESSAFFIFNDVSATELRFWLKTDTETGFDKFELFIDFVSVFEESGPTDWQLVTLPLAAAFETIEFRYTKDSSASVFSDACYVDEIVLGLPGTPGIPARPFVYTPLKMTDDGERLKVDVLDQTVSVTGRALDCALDSVTICTDGPIQVTVLDQPIQVTGTVAISSLPEVEIKNDVGNRVPVSLYETGTLANATQTSVAGSAVSIAAANGSRKAILIQNVGIANARVGVSGVTATTGLRLTPNQYIIFEMPYCPTQEIFAIREGAISTTLLAQEIT